MSYKKVGVNKPSFQVDTQRISNNQNVNPSFNFTWDTTKPAAKAFARIRNRTDSPGIRSVIKTTQETEAKISKNPETDASVAPAVRFLKPNPKSTETSELRTVGPQFKGKITETVFPKSEEVRPYIRFPETPQNIEPEIDPVASTTTEGYVQRKLRKKQSQAGVNAAGYKYERADKKYSLFYEKQVKKLHVQSQSGKSVFEKVFSEESFSDLKIHKHLLSNLNKNNFDKLTNVQAKAIPTLMEGNNTLIRSQTGSGKTLAYAVPIVNDLQSIIPRIKRMDGVLAVIVVPTRELCVQVHELFSQINTFQWIVVGHLCGGESRKSEKDRIRKGVNILIGTPGRLLDHILHTTALKIDRVKHLILDEADRLLDMGFRKDIVSLVEALDQAKTNTAYNPMDILKKSQNIEDSEPIKTEAEEEDCQQTVLSLSQPIKTGAKEENCRQTVLLSATLSKDVAELADFAMKHHVYIDALDNTSTILMDSFVVPDTVKQFFLPTYVRHRLFLLSALLMGKSKTCGKIFVFMASGPMVDYHYALFTQCLVKMPPKVKSVKHGNVPLYETFDSDGEDETVLDIEFFKLHGSMDQKERKDVFLRFRKAKTGVLICTDVAARGFDVPLADCIIQYTGPQTDEDYLHRIGRTGRAGQSGEAIIFLTHEEQEYVNHLRDHRVFLKKLNPEPYIRQLCTLMENPNAEEACTALQRRYEDAVAARPELLKMAYFAYSTWSRFYNSYPTKMRTIFDFKRANKGHYVTSFGIRETPREVGKQIRGHVETERRTKPEKRLNRKLDNHQDEDTVRRRPPKEKKQLYNKTVSLTTSEFGSGLQPLTKKQKK